jgi:hypothetical protein
MLLAALIGIADGLLTNHPNWAPRQEVIGFVAQASACVDFAFN